MYVPKGVIAKYGPNGRVHFRDRHQYTAHIRRQSEWIAGAIYRGEPLFGAVPFYVVIGLNKRQLSKPMDELNLHGHLAIKAAIDGVADAVSGGEDGKWICDGVFTTEDEANIGYVELIVAGKRRTTAYNKELSAMRKERGR